MHLKSIFSYFVFILFVFLFTSFSQAKDAFEERKSIAIEGVSKRISNLEESKKCMEGSQNKDELMKCQKNSREHMMQFRDEFKKNRLQRKQEQKEKKD